MTRYTRIGSLLPRRSAMGQGQAQLLAVRKVGKGSTAVDFTVERGHGKRPRSEHDLRDKKTAHIHECCG